MQQNDATIEQRKGKHTRRCVQSVDYTTTTRRTDHVLVLQCSTAQRTLIERFHKYLHAHWGWKKQLH